MLAHDKPEAEINHERLKISNKKSIKRKYIKIFIKNLKYYIFHFLTFCSVNSPIIALKSIVLRI